jgi:hypothetical protein
MIFVGGLVTWALALPSAILLGFMLLHGLRVIRQIALVLCLGSLFFAPAANGPLWLSAFALIGLILLLLPASREYCATNTAAELADS